MAAQSYQLIMRSGPTAGKSYELTKDEMFIGRDVNNDIIINDAEVSRKHARVMLQAGGYVLEDLGSTNGTFVNGHRLMGPHVLRSGETIMLGENVRLEFEASLDTDATLVAAPADLDLDQPRPAVDLPPPPAPVEVFTPPPPPLSARDLEPEPPPPARPEPAYRPSPPPPLPYSDQIPPGPAEAYYQEPVAEMPPPDRNRRMIIAGCGCLLLLTCLCLLVGVYLFDRANLYCAPPFDILSPVYEALFNVPCP